MIPRITLRKALADPHLLGRALGGESWQAWRALLIAAMGEELTDPEREIFRKLTGREREPGQRVEELVCVVGRRGGKSRALPAHRDVKKICSNGHPQLSPVQILRWVN